MHFRETANDLVTTNAQSSLAFAMLILFKDFIIAVAFFLSFYLHYYNKSFLRFTLCC